MKNKNLSLIAISIFLLMIFSSCENMNKKPKVVANPKVSTEDGGIKEKIENINKELEKLVLAGNYFDILPYYTDDIIICPDI